MSMGSSNPLPRHEQARRYQIRRAFAESNSAIFRAETLARHYTSLATTAVQLSECIIMSKRAGAENMDGAISHHVERLRQCHINDFGVEPSWAE